MTINPAISVIIPTHNRSALLRRVLDALSAQQPPGDQIEVLVIADGCTDTTAELLRTYQAPYSLRAFSQPAQGVAVARNRGAAEARAPIVLFLDDDVVPRPTTVAAHVAAQRETPGIVAVGPVENPAGSAFLLQDLRIWWNDYLLALQEPGHRITYRDFLSGNCSLKRDDFQRLGGFDPAFRRHQDWELGLRIIRAGLPIRFLPAAMADHHVTITLTRMNNIMHTEGRMDVLLATRYPEIIPQLPLAHYATIHPPAGRLRRPLRFLAFRRPELGDRLARLLVPAVQVAETLKLRATWRRWAYDLRDYWYWRGVAHAVGSVAALTDLVQRRPTENAAAARRLTVDLRQGLQAAADLVDRERPDELLIVFGDRQVGRIPPEPGAEPLRSVHLAPAIMRHLSYELISALAIAHTDAPTPLPLHKPIAE